MMMLFRCDRSASTFSLSYTLPIMINSLSYRAVKAQALSIPPYILATCVTLAVRRLSDRFQNRFCSIMGA